MGAALPSGVVLKITVGKESQVFRPIANAEGKRDADGELNGGDDKEGVPPVKRGDEPGEDDDHDAAGAGAHSHPGEGATAAAAKPVGDGDHAHRPGGGAHPYGDDDDGPVEGPQVLNAAEEDKPQGHGDHAEHHQPPRADAIHDESDDGGGDAADLGAQGEGEGSGGSTPAELVDDGVEESAKAVEEGAAGKEKDGGGGEDDPPAEEDTGARGDESTDAQWVWPSSHDSYGGG